MAVRDGGLDLWAAVLSRAASVGAPSDVINLLREASVQNCSADEISLEVSDSLAPESLSAARTIVARSAEELLGRLPNIDISLRTYGRTPPTFHGIPRPQLNENYAFEKFVIGPSNRLAHAAALAVAEARGQAFNPVFIYSAPGMGKSHLLQATCRKILDAHPDTALAYISCEDFQNLFFSAVQAGEIEGFRSRFRCAEILVVDDIHFLASRDRTQEEFFHTFNALYNAARQIVISCDCPPREIPQIEERLVSRFKWGLVAEIEAPVFETRLEIIRVKAALRGFTLPADVMECVARRNDASIRELEGAVLKIVGYSSLLGTPIDISLAEEVLDGPSTRRAGEKPVTIEDIMSAVSDYYGITSSQLKARGRARSISLPRQVCMFLARDLTRHSLEAIGAHLGGRDHSTVKHACDKITGLQHDDSDVSEALRAVKRRLSRSGV